MNFQVHYSCSQCGAPFTFEEGERILYCPYCRVKSLLVGEKYLRYFLPPKYNQEECLYVPYLRVKGPLFFTTTHDLIPLWIDSTILGLEKLHFPLSLGLRAQAMPLQMVYSQNLNLIQEELSFKQALAKIKNRLANSKVRGTIYYQDFIGENLSYIYLPLLPQKGYYFDALAQRPLSPVLNPAELTFHQQENWQLNILPALCPKCGYTLEGQNKDLLLICKNCSNLYYFETEKLEIINPYLLFSTPDDLYLPFWQFEIDFAEEDSALERHLHSLYLVKVNNLVLSIPAFAVRPDYFIKFATALSLSPLLRTNNPFSLEEKINYISPTVSRKEAITSLRLILGNLIKNKEILQELKKLKIKIKKFKLTFIPFIQNHIELIQPHLQLAINKNSFRFFIQ
jgi:DNA-directed RNA polymerase subunit RPC12/RpoP